MGSRLGGSILDVMMIQLVALLPTLASVAHVHNGQRTRILRSVWSCVRCGSDNRLVSVAANDEWYLVSSRGSVLIYIATKPDCTIHEIADAMSLTCRSVRSILGDLRRAGMLNVRKEGRRHHYTVNLEAPFLHPTLSGFTLRPILWRIAEQGSRRPAAGS
jgi:DNA-binding transcriptional ArsR family regulator